MKKLIFISLTMLLLALQSCADLSVENLNDPDRELATQNPGDIEGLVVGGYNTWALMASWRTLLPHTVQSDWGTGTVGNWWVNNGGHVPREEFPNTPTASYRDVNQDFWDDFNGSMANANIAIAAIEGGVIIEDEAYTLAIKAAAQFLQALNLGSLGLMYDQAFIIDETTDLENLDGIELVPYDVVLLEALNKIEAARATIGLARNAGMDSLPSGLIPSLGTIDSRWSAVGSTISWDNFEKIMNSYAATFIVMGARSVTENDQINWQEVYDYASAGIDFDFAPISDNNTNWQSQLLRYLYADWVRPNLNIINLMDPDMPKDFFLVTDWSEL
jgi:hypothetical protein